MSSKLPPINNNNRKGRRNLKKNNFELDSTPTKQTMIPNIDSSFQNQTNEHFLTRENNEMGGRQKDLFDLEITKIHRKNSIHEISIDNNKHLDFSLVDKDEDAVQQKKKQLQMKNQQYKQQQKQYQNQNQNQDEDLNTQQSSNKKLYEQKKKQQEVNKLSIPEQDQRLQNISGVRKNRKQVQDLQIDSLDQKKQMQNDRQKNKQRQVQSQKNELKVLKGQEQSDEQAQAKKDDFEIKKKKWMRQNMEMIRNAKLQSMKQKLEQKQSQKKMPLLQAICPKIRFKSIVNLIALLFVVAILAFYIMNWTSNQYMACILYDLQVYFQPDISNNYQIYKYFTSAFLHGGVIHFAFSLFSLLFFGYNLEFKYGALKIILVFFYCSVIGCTFGGLQNSYLIQSGGSYSTMGILGLQLSIFYCEYKITQRHKGKIMNYIIYIIFGIFNMIVGPMESKFVNLLGNFMGYLFGIFFGVIFIDVKGLAQQMGRYRKLRQNNMKMQVQNQIFIDNVEGQKDINVNQEKLQKIESVQKFFFGVFLMLGVMFIIISCVISTDEFEFTDKRCEKE